MEKLLEKIAMRLLAKAENSKSVFKAWFYYFLLSVLNNIVYAFYQDQKSLGRMIWGEAFIFSALSAVAILLRIDILVLPAFAVAVFLFVPRTRNMLYLGTAVAAYFSILVTVVAVRHGIEDRAVVVVEVLSILIGYGFVMAGEWVVLSYKKLKNTFSKLVKVLGLLAFIAIVVFLSSNAYAFNPKHVEFDTYGGYDAVYNAFHFISLIFSDKGYQGLFFTVMALSLFIAGFRNYIQTLQGRSTGNILSWTLPILISFTLYMGLIVPKGEVTIYDTVLNKSGTVNGIPIAITTMAGITSEVESGIISMIDTTSIDRDVDYENSAGGIGVMTIMNMAIHGVRSSDVYLDKSLKRYINDCVFYDLNDPGVDAAHKITYQELIAGDEPLSNVISKAAVFQSIYTVYYDASHNSGETMTCHDAWTNISNILNNNTNFDAPMKNICASAGIDTSNMIAFNHCKDVITAYLNVLYGGKYSDVTGDAYNFIRQDYVASEIYRAAVEADANFLVNYKISNAGMNIGMAFNNWIPTIRAVLIALGLSILPFLIIFLPTPLFGKVLGGIAGVFVFIISWSAIDATIHQFLVSEASVLFQSVLTKQVGYASFATMSTPLQHTMAAWGYVRSLGMGLAVIATGIVTKTGAYGLQMAAGRMESAVASRAETTGEMATNLTEQGTLEKEIMTSSAFSQKIAPSYTYQDLINGTANTEAKRIGQGLAYKNITDASTTGYNAESMSAGRINAEANIAEQNGLTPRHYGGLQGKESGARNITNWKTAGHGNMDIGALISGHMQGATIGGTAAGKNAATNGNVNEVASISAKTAAKNLTKEKRQFEAAAQTLHLPNNIQTAIKLGKMQGGRIENVVLSKQEAQEIFGANAPGGLYSISMSDNGHVLQAVAKNGIDMFEVTPNGVKHFDLTNNGQKVWSEQKRGRESVYKDLNTTTIGSSEHITTPDASINVTGTTNGEAVAGTINGDVGEGLRRAHFRDISRGLVDALKGANGIAQVNKGQLSFIGTVSGRTAIALGNYLMVHGNKVAGEHLITIGKHGGTAHVDLIAGKTGIPQAVIKQKLDTWTNKHASDSQNIDKKGIQVSVGDAFKNAVEIGANTGDLKGFDKVAMPIVQDSVQDAKIANAAAVDFATAVTSGIDKKLNIDRQALYRIKGGINLSKSLIGEVLGVSAGTDLVKGKTVSGNVVLNSAQAQAKQFYINTMKSDLTPEQKEKAIRDYVKETNDIFTELQKKGLNNVANYNSNIATPTDKAKEAKAIKEMDKAIGGEMNPYSGFDTSQSSNSFNIHEYEKRRAAEKNSTQEMLRKLDNMKGEQSTENGESVSESQNNDDLNPPSGFSRR